MWMSHMYRVYVCLDDIKPGLSRKVLGLGLTSGAVGYVAVRSFRYLRSRQVVRERGEAAKLACQTLREYLQQKEKEEEEEGPKDEDKEETIVGYRLFELRNKLWVGELTAVEVLRAYQRKALAVNDSLNCITEPIFEAEALAVDLDMMPPNQRKSRPLFGIPISIKDSVMIEGYDCHGGFSALANELAEKDADIVQILKELGAIPFVRTNFPQGLMSFACSNPMYGVTVNPRNKTRCPGGSSGGEGALIGAGGSIAGIGSDIGGSIRIPSQWCGIYGLKPTVGRTVIGGHWAIGRGQTSVQLSIGPMARDMESLIMLTQAILTPRLHSVDPYVPPVSFRDEMFKRKGPLCVGFYTHLEGVSPHPANIRAVQEAKISLENKGYKIVEFKPPRPMDAVCDIFMKVVFGDGGEENNSYLKHDVIDSSLAFTYYLGKLPGWLKRLIARLICFKDPMLGRMSMAATSAPKSVADWWKLQEAVQDYKSEFYEAWQKQKLDALICPGMPFPAVTTGSEDKVMGGVLYTTLYNLLNYPAGMLPVSWVNKNDLKQLRDPTYYPQTGAIEKFVVQDSEETMGLPMSVQVVSLPYHEEMVLRVMRDINSI